MFYDMCMIYFRRVRALLAPAAAALVLGTSALAHADYDEGPVWRHWAGDGSAFVGEAEYCARSGYPSSTLVLEDRFSDEVRALRAGPTDALLLLADSDDELVVRLYAERGEDCAVGVMTIEFADGERWNIRRGGSGQPIVWERETQRGTRKHDRLRGSGDADALAGLEGDDKLYGYAGSDALWGGPGSDVLYGYQGNDVLVGDEGDDDLYGDGGDDLYIFHFGAGDDLIDDDRGDLAISLRDRYSHLVTLRRRGWDLEITIEGRADRVTVRDYFDRAGVIRRLAFADVVWDAAEVAAHIEM
jgi:hypothetical protein